MPRRKGVKVIAIMSGVPTTEAMRILGCTRSNVAHLCREGYLRSVRVGNSNLIDPDSIQEYLDSGVKRDRSKSPTSKRKDPVLILPVKKKTVSKKKAPAKKKTVSRQRAKAKAKA